MIRVMREKIDRKTRNEIILIAGLLILALCSYIAIRYYQKLTTKEAYAVIYIDGEEYNRYSLNEDVEVSIPLKDGAYNKLVIKDGYADMVEASCPDKICVDHNKVKNNGESITCLPNKVVIVIENGQSIENEVDVTTN